MTQYEFQRGFCEISPRPILNIASKEDPGHLADDFDATNLDLLVYDPHTRRDLTKLKNFVNGDARALPFKDGEYGAAVLGEFIEHCEFAVAVQAIKEAMRVLIPGGRLCLTFPLDGRDKYIQHESDKLVVWAEGITSWHQTVWNDADLIRLFDEAGVVELTRERTEYGFANGHGIIVERKAE